MSFQSFPQTYKFTRSMMGRLVFGLQCHVGAYKDTFFPRTLSTPNGTVTLLCVPSLRSWKKIKLTKPIFSSMALRLTQRTCLWHSWTTCLRTESFLKPFGLQDLRIFLRPIFSLGCDGKLSALEQSPHKLWVEDGHHRIHSERGPCYTEHSSACQ